MNFNHGLTKIFAVLFIVFGFGINIAKAQPSIYTLPVGTKFRVRMDNEINSKVSNINDTFTATLSQPVIVRNVELIAAGSVVEGKIINVKNAGSGKVNGILEVKFETLRLSNEILRSIDGSLVNTNLLDKNSNAFSIVSILGGTAIGAILGAVGGKAKGAGIGAGVGAGIGTTATFLKKGREARIKANQEFEIILNKEVTVPAKDF